MRGSGDGGTDEDEGVGVDPSWERVGVGASGESAGSVGVNCEGQAGTERVGAGVNGEDQGQDRYVGTAV